MAVSILIYEVFAYLQKKEHVKPYESFTDSNLEVMKAILAGTTPELMPNMDRSIVAIYKAGLQPLPHDRPSITEVLRGLSKNRELIQRHINESKHISIVSSRAVPDTHIYMHCLRGEEGASLKCFEFGMRAGCPHLHSIIAEEQKKTVFISYDQLAEYISKGAIGLMQPVRTHLKIQERTRKFPFGYYNVQFDSRLRRKYETWPTGEMGQYRHPLRLPKEVMVEARGRHKTHCATPGIGANADADAAYANYTPRRCCLNNPYRN